MFLCAIASLFLSCGEDEIVNYDVTPYAPPELIYIYNSGVGNEEIVTIGSKELCFAISYSRFLDSEILEFTPIQGQWPLVMKDQYGQNWNAFGQSEDNRILKPVISSFGYWFAWSSIYPGIELLNEPKIEVDIQSQSTAEWDIPYKYVFTGANFDAIQGFVYPEFITYDPKDDIRNGFFLNEDDLVILLAEGDNVRVYPHRILNYHEIVNDSINGQQIAVIYSPFTATTSVWNREINNKVETFGSSGMIYNNNILPFDRNSESIWSQLLGRCVSGFKKGLEPELIPYIETKWSVVKELYENPRILSPYIDSDHNYSEYPFDDYRTNHDYLYAPNLLYEDTRLKRKDRVYGVGIGDEALGFLINDFE